MKDFKFELGSVARDRITGFKGVVVCRTQWLNGCNTYGLAPQELKDGQPLERQHLELLESNVFAPKRDDGGPPKPVFETNR